MHDLPSYKGIFTGYTLSYDYKPYISYPKDNWCLDYVLLPDNFKFMDLELIEEYTSDHKGLSVEIE